MNKRLLLWLSLLVAAVVFGAAGACRRHYDEAGLRPLAEELTEQLRVSLDATPPGRMGYLVAHTVTVSRPWLVIGAPVAKIAIYARPRAAKGDRSVQGYEYHLALRDGAWQTLDSAYCTDEQCQQIGAALLDSVAAAP